LVPRVGQLGPVRRLPHGRGRPRAHLPPVGAAPAARRRGPDVQGRQPHPRPALALLVAEVRGGREQRRPPAGQGVPPVAGVGPHSQAATDAAGRHGARPPDRQEHGCLPRAPGGGARRMILSPSETAATVDSIARIQLHDGMIPWFPGGHCDPWNHVEAAMALTLGGRVAEAERAYGWLAATQHPSGAWFNYYLVG